MHLKLIEPGWNFQKSSHPDTLKFQNNLKGAVNINNIVFNTKNVFKIVLID